MRNPFVPLRAGPLLLTLALLLAACGQPAAAPPTAEPTAVTAPTTEAAATAAPTTEAAATAAPAPASGATIKIGSKNFTEAILVAELYAQVLEANGFTVERKFNLGATPIAQAALVGGDIDLYPEYTSTGLLEVLKAQPIADAKGILEAVRTGYEAQFQLTWLDASPFNNTNTFALTKARADELGVKTFSDLAAKSADLKLGGPPEFPEREDNKAVLAAYGFDPKFGGENYVQLDAGSLRYEALTRGDIDVVVAFGTDGQLSGLGLTALEDDKSAYPIYQIAPVVRQDTLAANPGLAEALNTLAPALTNAVVSGLNWQVDGPDKQEIPAVASAFLKAQGLIK
ncbi:MAG: quaternary ammonium transporter [Chloroflexales bacterium]|nr:quaternary ammonium transporter [Chloroflexales bacterium]